MSDEYTNGLPLDSEVWEIIPVILGGDPTDDSNKTVVSREKHIELVRWWNRKIADMRRYEID